MEDFSTPFMSFRPRFLFKEAQKWRCIAVKIRGGASAGVQLGTITIADTSNHTMTLSDSLSKYKYLYLSNSAFDGVNDTSGFSTARKLFTVAALKSGSIVGYYTVGNDGSLTSRTVTMTYLTDTTVRFKQSASQSRTHALYGIK